MKRRLFKRLSLLQTRNVVFIFLAITLLIIISSVIEYFQTRSEMLNLMELHSHTLLESIVMTTENALLADEEIKRQLKTRLLDNANFVNTLHEKNQITTALLNKLVLTYNIDRINILSKDGKVLLSGMSDYYDFDCEMNYEEILFPIINRIEDTLFLNVKLENCTSKFKYITAISSKNGDVVTIEIISDEINNLRKTLGFGSLIRKLTNNKEIIYLALQDTSTILVASGKLPNLEPIISSNFLYSSLKDSTFKWRIVDLDSLQIFESVHPFYHKDKFVGLFRLGLSTESLDLINTRIVRRIIIISIILIAFGTLIFIFIFTRQNFNVLQNKFRAIEEYSTKIIENVSDAIIVIDSDRKIKLLNKSAEKIFSVSKGDVIEKELDAIITDINFNHIIDDESIISEIQLDIEKIKKYLLISKAIFRTDDGKKNIVLVIKDFTEQKKMEEQLERQERMTAMGQLASGVAHEIRNPLNAISTITQQLNKDFTPVNKVEEYQTLTSLVNKEVKRINETVQNFLKFARPEKINPVEFYLSELINDYKNEYLKILQDKKIDLQVLLTIDELVYWDKKQIQQVFINLIQNAIDSFERDDKEKKIIINISKKLENILIKYSDNGRGIDEKTLPKIFNLYFTTKAKGTGIGLAIVQKIIYEHNGTISVTSELNRGTTFTIELPIRYK
ncbi:MAG: PAS domain S-box protein [Ignavibacteriales bacterium]|nr:PAS domain S-box protein [Ignavibacteriales bacterium]